MLCIALAEIFIPNYRTTQAGEGVVKFSHLPSDKHWKSSCRDVDALWAEVY